MMVTWSSTYSLSVPLSVVETGLRRQAAPSSTVYQFKPCVHFSLSCLSLFHLQYLNLLVVMADSASVCIPELEFEIPSHSHKGSVTTVESIITKAVTRLEQEQPERKVHTLTRNKCYLINVGIWRERSTSNHQTRRLISV